MSPKKNEKQTENVKIEKNFKKRERKRRKQEKLDKCIERHRQKT
jgi:hypothetical protein